MTQIFEKLNWIDLLVVILLIRSSYIGFTKGFGWELFRFVGYLCTAVVCVYYYEYFSQLSGRYLPVLYPFSNFLSFSGIYILILIIFNFINLIIAKIVKIETFSAVERFGGLLFGFLRGAILTSLLLISLVLVPVPYFEKSVKERSCTGQVVLKIVPYIYEKVSVFFPVLKFNQRNKALSELTNLKDGLFIFRGVKSENPPARGLLRGDVVK